MAQCPICKKLEADQKFRPFCSLRCADIDLHRWIGGHYAIPAVESADDWDGALDERADADGADDDINGPH